MHENRPPDRSWYCFSPYQCRGNAHSPWYFLLMWKHALTDRTVPEREMFGFKPQPVVNLSVMFLWFYFFLNHWFVFGFSVSILIYTHWGAVSCGQDLMFGLTVWTCVTVLRMTSFLQNYFNTEDYEKKIFLKKENYPSLWMSLFLLCRCGVVQQGVLYRDFTRFERMCWSATVKEEFLVVPNLDWVISVR